MPEWHLHQLLTADALRDQSCRCPRPLNHVPDTSINLPQVAIITGAGQGLGAAAAALFAQHGAAVVVSDLDGAKAAQVAEEIRQAGGQALSHAGGWLQTLKADI